MENNNNYKFWLGGFVEGEGSLTISIVKYDKATHGFLLQPEFNIAQHINGLDILKSFKILFNNKGQIHKKAGSINVWVYTLKGINNLNDYLIPFFDKYSLQGQKRLDYIDFKKVSEIVSRKEHLNEKGYNEILRIKKGMNLKRI